MQRLEVSCAVRDIYIYIYNISRLRVEANRNSEDQQLRCSWLFILYLKHNGRHAVIHLVKTLRYIPEGRRFDSRLCHWNFSLTYNFLPHYGTGVETNSNRNYCQEYFLWGVKAAGG